VADSVAALESMGASSSLPLRPARVLVLCLPLYPPGIQLTALRPSETLAAAPRQSHYFFYGILAAAGACPQMGYNPLVLGRGTCHLEHWGWSM